MLSQVNVGTGGYFLSFYIYWLMHYYDDDDALIYIMPGSANLEFLKKNDLILFDFRY